MAELDVNGRGLDAGCVRSFDFAPIVVDEGTGAAVPPVADTWWFPSPLDRLILTDDGMALGVVADLEIDADGRVVAILDDAGMSHDGAGLRAVGSYAVVVFRGARGRGAGARRAGPQRRRTAGCRPRPADHLASAEA